LGPGVTPALFSEALFSVGPLELLAAVEPVFGLTPLVGPLPASFVDMAPLVGPLPASAFGCANAEPVRQRAIANASKLLLNEDMVDSFGETLLNQLDLMARVPLTGLLLRMCQASPYTKSWNA
jgi:hypothetical protein